MYMLSSNLCIFLCIDSSILLQFCIFLFLHSNRSANAPPAPKNQHHSSTQHLHHQTTSLFTIIINNIDHTMKWNHNNNKNTGNNDTQWDNGNSNQEVKQSHAEISGHKFSRYFRCVAIETSATEAAVGRRWCGSRRWWCGTQRGDRNHGGWSAEIGKDKSQ